MESDMLKDEILKSLEVMLEGGLRAVRRELGDKRSRKPRQEADGRKSNIAIVADILKESESPLHIDEIIARARRNGIELKRESIVSAITKNILEHRRFIRTGRNVFGTRKEDEGK